jgi:hypothetical protein
LPRAGFDSNYRQRNWLVQCECGRLRIIPADDLLKGRSSSCGCTPHRKNGDNGKKAPVRSENAKSLARTEALRTRLQRVMNGLRPEGAKTEVARESDLFGENTESDRRMIV